MLDEVRWYSYGPVTIVMRAGATAEDLERARYGALAAFLAPAITRYRRAPCSAFNTLKNSEDRENGG